MKYKFISSVAVPTLLIITGVLGYLTIQNGWNFEISSYAIFLLTILYIFILEQIIPLRKDWKPKKQTIWTDIKHLIFSAAIFDALGKMLALTLVIYIQETFFTVSEFWNSLPYIAIFIIANLIGDFLPYWYHRISHIGHPNSYLSILLWKIHSIHHLPTEMNWLKTHWVHPINMFLNTFLKMTPLLLLGFSKDIVFLVGVTHIVITYISHANIQSQKSVWDYLVVTPQLHHFHHSKNIDEAKNFGNIFPFWDLLFGTYYNRKGAVKDVGVLTTNTIAYPKSTAFFKQLWYPFTGFKHCCR